MQVENWTLEKIIPYDTNPKTHQVEWIVNSIKIGLPENLPEQERRQHIVEKLVDQPIVVDGQGVIIKGHGRRKAAEMLGLSEFPVVVRTDLTAEEVRLARIADNRSQEGGWDTELLGVEMSVILESIPEIDFDSLGLNTDWFNTLGVDLTPSDSVGGGSLDGQADRNDGALLKRFIIPPFSIFDTRQGYWFERRRAWESVLDTKKSKEGRDDLLTFATSAKGEAIYRLRNKMRAKTGEDPTWEKIIAEAKKQGLYLSDGTSVFDPVVCEVCYKWFCPDNGTIIDPFAGGSVRGMIASYLAYQYHGIDLRQQQVDENYKQSEILKSHDIPPTWYCGNSLNLDKIIPSGVVADFIFSCPPYYDLEKYSDNPEDLSNVTWDDFCLQYAEIIAKAVARLRPDRFACFVVGDVRDKKGFYRNFVNVTIESFQKAGALLYNYIVLINNVASLAIRANGIFSPYRKVGKQHQDILVFYKGNPKKIKDNFGEIEVEELMSNVN